MEKTAEIETFNRFFVGLAGDRICFLRQIPSVISKDDALLLAAYLVSMVGDDERWQQVLTAVQNA